MKKAIKIFIGILILFLGILIAIPYLFEDKIVELVKETANNNVNAKVDFNNVDISLISSFPNAKVSLNNLSIINKKPFDGDILASAKSFSLQMPIVSLFTSTSKEINVSYIAIDEATINVLVNTNGEANYNITKESTTSSTENNQKNSGIKLQLDGYSIENSSINYTDASTGMILKLENFNHKGSGNFSEAISELKTETSSNVSFEYEKTSYLKNNSVQLTADIAMDLNQQKFTFLENEALINQLPLVFNGFVKLNENNQEIDLNFKTPSSDFKNFLALIPEQYSKNISDVKTTGNFSVEGNLKGIVDEKHIPQFNINIASNNASFKYPDLPKTIQNIQIKTNILNTTGITNDTKVNIENLAFKIDDDVFTSSAFISNIINNPKIKAKAKGTVNLAKISKAYPMESIKDLQGVVTADFETAFDMNSIEKKQYENTKNTGNILLTGFKYEGDEMANPLEIENAKVTFNTKSVQLNNFEAKTGESDLKMNGTIENLIGFVLNNEAVKGNFNLNSNTFNLNDFMVTETETTEDKKPDETTSEQLKIPSFLDCTINANANNVIYDNLTLKNVKGNLVIKDEKADLKNLSSGLFNGNVIMNGNVSTKTETPTFAFNLDIKDFDIAQSFTQLELFSALAPIANILQGKINTDLKVSGNLNNDLTPNLATLSGNALSELLTSKSTLENSKALSLLSNNLDFINLKDLNLEKIKTSLTFKDGKISIKPFNLNYKDIPIEISGKHGLDQTMDYNVTFDVPAKYLGSEASNLIAKLSEQEKDNITVPVTANILGSFTQPSVKTDLKQAVTNLTAQLVETQKNKLIDKGTSELTKLLNGNKKSSDSTKTESNNALKNTANQLINGLFKKKKVDTTKKE
ncbi:AsmA-like C-terminal region-containing protein [Lutibacter sp. TH_r2]|uniref:AsmA family protein n=1 Tax=Lutibacter sp. TH_r2 TaxID=3082083 RepID=UPI00295439F6|nr:AsmA-like C-terminal region-containing protein [Lutibacter sp. TH_r2]MDV7186979.1 AsmA-like C-terminal region-containing protein [Lutibacter sp. TH_r2]